MKLNKAALAILAVFILALALGFAASFFAKEHRLEPEKSDYHIYAANYPCYAISRLITEDVPDMHLNMLMQPQLSGYASYELSDWDQALLSGADVAVFMGNGFEEASAYTNESTAIISLLSLATLEASPEDCLILDFSLGETPTYSPWLYITPSGAMQLCEIMCGNMAYLDQMYSSNYYDNLDKAYELLSPFDEELRSLDVIQGVKVAVAHDAFLYTAKELDAKVALSIRRDTVQSLSEDEVRQCINALNENDIQVLFIERQADADMIKAFEDAGITVMRQELMLDIPETFSYQGLIDSYKANTSEIEKAFSK